MAQVKLLNLSHDLLTTTLPFVLSKVDRVSYGLLSADQVETPRHFLDTSLFTPGRRPPLGRPDRSPTRTGPCTSDAVGAPVV